MTFSLVISIRNKIYLKEFGVNLQKLRLFKKLSQEELAYEADIPISQVGRIERGEINTTVSTIKALARALGMHPQRLFEFDAGSK